MVVNGRCCVQYNFCFQLILVVSCFILNILQYFLCQFGVRGLVIKLSFLEVVDIGGFFDFIFFFIINLIYLFLFLVLEVCESIIL